jgi:DNA-binding NtrC family response regulator
VGDDILDTVPLSASAAELIRRAPVPDPRVSLLVFHRGGGRLVSLEPGASVTIGREPPADVVVPDRSLSRKHARFTWSDGEVIVEDLASTNGTLLRGDPVTRAAMRRGDVVTLGGVAVSLHELGGGDAPGIDGEDRFRASLDDEVRRARHFGRPLSLLLLGPMSAAIGRRAARRGEQLARWCAVVRPLLSPVDRLAVYGPDCLAVLSPEAAADAAGALARKVVAACRAEAGAGVLDAAVAVATFPESGGSADELIEACAASLRETDAEQPVRVTARAASRALPPPVGRGAARPVVESSALRSLFRTLDRVATSVVPVLLFGETGSGKEVVAREIHARGPRKAAPLVCVNCGAIPAQLVESTLFGHERGAFTGATQQHRGVFEAAHGGTVLLDEIGELPAAAQAALLRVLESKRIVRVGSTREVEVDVRVIAATHRDLDAMVAAQQFRDDLYYRLNVVKLDVPPLRQRVEEIAPLAARFVEEANAANGRQVRGIDPEAVTLLGRYSWPGNVRELRNVIDRAVVVTEGDIIGPDDLPERVQNPTSLMMPRATAAAAAAPGDTAQDMKSQLQRFEADAILAALRRADWNQSEAARALKIPLRTLVFKIKRYGIKKLGYGME